MVVQALYDSGVSRKKGTAGIFKLIDLVNSIFKRISHTENIDDFVISPLSYFLPDMGDKDTFMEFCKKFNIKYYFGRQHQGKAPDLVLKAREHFFIVEAKHVKESGGAQNKQVQEVIEFIRYSEDSSNVHYVSFMDGLYFNRFARYDSEDGKIARQKEDIERYLKENAQNFFVNTAGFRVLLKDLKRTLRGKL